MKRLTVVCALLLVLPCMAWAVDCPIPDTGQTKCYDNTQEITCPNPGEPFSGQDAQYITNPQSYTKLDANGNDLPDETTEWVMVQDNVTGLIWEVKTDDGSIHDKDNTYTWQNAQDVFIADLNTPPGFGGFTDWRLPTIKELSFIVHSDLTGPAIDQSYFPNTVSSWYWSSTTYALNTDYARYVNFGKGGVSNRGKSGHNYVRAVRAGQCGSFGDSDGDEICNDEDSCPYSNLEATIIIDGCDSKVENHLFGDGCTMRDLIGDCENNPASHGKCVSCVSHLTNAWKKAGLITGKQKGAIQSCAAQADIP